MKVMPHAGYPDESFENLMRCDDSGVDREVVTRGAGCGYILEAGVCKAASAAFECGFCAVKIECMRM